MFNTIIISFISSLYASIITLHCDDLCLDISINNEFKQALPSVTNIPFTFEIELSIGQLLSFSIKNGVSRMGIAIGTIVNGKTFSSTDSSLISSNSSRPLNDYYAYISGGNIMRAFFGEIYEIHDFYFQLSENLAYKGFSVKIGKNVIIGSGSVVTKDIPDNTIAVGNPCRVIKTIDKE